MANTKTIFIIESPGKIKKIQEILDKLYGKGEFIVVASIGHIRDLDPSKMSIDIEHNYEPIYKILPDKVKVVNELKKLYIKNKNVVLACDQDREGEQICDSIVEELGIKNYKRIYYNEITEAAIKDAMLNPSKSVNVNLVNAQKGRRVIDRLTGYKLSPIIWKMVAPKLSVGRVQSVITRLLVDKEEEIKKLEQTSYFKTIAQFKDYATDFVLNNLEKDKNDILSGDLAKITDINLMRDLLHKMQKSKFIVKSAFDKFSTKNPSPPYITSTLQIDCNKRFGMSAKTTMMVAQKLYEAGHITYMRTDSTMLSKYAMDNIQDYIKTKYGDSYFKSRVFTNKTKNTQEAHECIRPTHIDKPNLSLKEDEIKVYQLIWKRTIASQMSEAKIKTNIIQIIMDNIKNYYFEGKINTIIFDGFLKIYSNLEDDLIISKKELTKNEKLELEQITSKEEFTRNIQRYNEGTLVKRLEELGIGRPSTYAAMIAKIQEKNYVIKKDIQGIRKEIVIFTLKQQKLNESKEDIEINKESNKLVPTELGISLTHFLIKHFPNIMDYEFTAQMEDQLDLIVDEKIIWYKMIDKFYVDLLKMIDILIKTNTTSEKSIGTKNNIEYFTKLAKYGPVVYKIEKNKKIYAPIKPPLTSETLTLDQAEQLLEYPKLLGLLNKKKVELQMGQYGCYIKYDKQNFGIKEEDLGNIDLEKAKEIIAKSLEEKKKVVLHEVKYNNKIYEFRRGPYGLYIKVLDPKNKTKKTNLKLSAEFTEDNLKDITTDNIADIINKSYENKKKRFVKKK